MQSYWEDDFHHEFKPSGTSMLERYAKDWGYGTSLGSLYAHQVEAKRFVEPMTKEEMESAGYHGHTEPAPESTAPQEDTEPGTFKKGIDAEEASEKRVARAMKQRTEKRAEIQMNHRKSAAENIGESLDEEEPKMDEAEPKRKNQAENIVQEGLRAARSKYYRPNEMQEVAFVDAKGRDVYEDGKGRYFRLGKNGSRIGVIPTKAQLGQDAPLETGYYRR